ncbi:MAG: glycerol-3-phosphate 1-O-acyltransferase PlsY, partial [Rhodospirillales bacterium]|nr:glycerol-3-phosphate 1-O-acyltransferase PlsY [Rhodospirillales bacterium]
MNWAISDSVIIMSIAAFGGYILGSIPFGLVLTRMAGLGDIRTIGSGNIGATNVLRTGNKPLALMTLLLDGGKGGIAVALGMILSGSFEASLLAGTAAVIGHNFPVWLKFKGGKGVATTIGMIFIAAWPVGLAVCLCWLVVAAISRYSSLSAITALCLSPVFSWFLVTKPDSVSMCITTGLMGLLSAIRHHENISRL